MNANIEQQSEEGRVEIPPEEVVNSLTEQISGYANRLAMVTAYSKLLEKKLEEAKVFIDQISNDSKSTEKEGPDNGIAKQKHSSPAKG